MSDRCTGISSAEAASLNPTEDHWGSLVVCALRKQSHIAVEWTYPPCLLGFLSGPESVHGIAGMTEHGAFLDTGSVSLRETDCVPAMG